MNAEAYTSDNSTLEPASKHASHPGYLDSPQFLTLDDIAYELQVSPDIACGILGRGGLPFVRTGRVGVRVHREAFLDWRFGQEEKNLTPSPQ